MFESEKSDSSVVRKSMSETDEWEKEEVHAEEVVLTSSTDREPAVHATLNSLSCQDFGLGELAFADEQTMNTSRSVTGKWIKGRTAADAIENRLNQW